MVRLVCCLLLVVAAAAFVAKSVAKDDGWDWEARDSVAEMLSATLRFFAAEASIFKSELK